MVATGDSKKRAHRLIRLCISAFTGFVIFFLNCSIPAFAAEDPSEELNVQVIEEALSEVENVEVPVNTEEATAEPDVDASFYWYDDTQHFQVTEADKLWIAKVVHVESGYEPYEGKVAVASVVLNRWACTDAYAHFDNSSIEAVCKQKGQFADISRAKPSEEDLLAVEDACNGMDPTVTEAFPNGAYYFYNPNHTSWKNLQARKDVASIVIGNHTFHSWFRKDAALHSATL